MIATRPASTENRAPPNVGATLVVARVVSLKRRPIEPSCQLRAFPKASILRPVIAENRWILCGAMGSVLKPRLEASISIESKETP